MGGISLGGSDHSLPKTKHSRRPFRKCPFRVSRSPLYSYKNISSRFVTISLSRVARYDWCLGQIALTTFRRSRRELPKT